MKSPNRKAQRVARKKAAPRATPAAGRASARARSAKRTPSRPSKLRKLAVDLRKFALTFPGAYEEYPWGERVVKAANNKVFVFLGDPYMLDGHVTLTVKLPASRAGVLKLPFAKPCGYGLGKHGWVTIRLTPTDPQPPMKTITNWMRESHRAVSGSA